MQSEKFITRVLLSLQQSLLGNVTKSMSAILVSCSEKNIYVRVVFDEDITDLDKEFVDYIETAMLSHFLPDLSVSCLAVFVAKGEAIIPKDSEFFAFRRAR